MRLLFIHDHPFFKDDKVIYSGGAFPKQLWNNYLINFKNIVVYARNTNSIQSKNSVSSRPNVSFILTNKYSSAINLIKNKNEIELELENLINQADVILTRLPSVLGFIAGEVALRHNKPFWIEQVGNAREALTNYGSILGKVSAPFFEYQNRKLISKADFVSYVTESKLQKDYPANNNAITVSISNVIINKALKEEELNKERFFGKIFRIGLIGGFDAKYKGQNILLKAISLLEGDIRKNIKISFIGKGDYSWVSNLAQDLGLKENIEFIGPLKSGDEINTFLNTLSLYVQPSLTEGMPRATIEAMAMGCPVIGSNVGGIPDIVSDIFVHRRGNTKELSSHIKKLYLDRECLNKESFLSLEKAIPYLKSNLDKKRLDFYAKMNKHII